MQLYVNFEAEGRDEEVGCVAQRMKELFEDMMVRR
jgi:hypothetical protein